MLSLEVRPLEVILELVVQLLYWHPAMAAISIS